MVILGVDLGKARTGVAVCDKSELLASPVEVVNEHNRERLLERVAQLAKERRARADRCRSAAQHGWQRGRKRAERARFRCGACGKDRAAR